MALTSQQAPLEDRLRHVGMALGASFRDLLSAQASTPQRPNRLAALLGVNRAVASRLLSAIATEDPFEVLNLMPGPEPLRRVVAGLVDNGAPLLIGEQALAAVEAFDVLIREEAGTRPALDALLCHHLPGAREKFELSSKYSVYKGVSQLKGAQGELWLGIAVVAPSKTDPERHDLTWLTGALAVQRLRPGVDIRFSYRHHRTIKPGDEALPEPPPDSILALDEFCINPPAALETHIAGDTIHYTLPDKLLGPKAKVDMFVVDHHPAVMRRRIKAGTPPTERTRSSLFLEPAIPVANMLFDVYLHQDVYPGSDPQLIQYDTSYRGIANVNDAARDIDRVDVKEAIEYLGTDMRRVDATELPSYPGLLAHLAERFAWDPAKFRGYRTRIQYPVYGWQTSLSFQPPPAE